SGQLAPCDRRDVGVHDFRAVWLRTVNGGVNRIVEQFFP
ncbi:MAG: hypothetical protein QOF97_116, partial [Acidimicrobiaceae bacterium]